VIVEALAHARVIAVVRAADAETAVRTADALIEGGIRAIELTFTTPRVQRALVELAHRHPDALLGAGTVTEEAQIDAATEAGASFLVSPGSPPQLVESMVETGRTVIAGCLTPTEIMGALSAGAHAVKLFPAGAVGPGYLTALRGPFPQLKLIPTGGIGPADVDRWLEAGAVAVGIGGALARPVEDDDDHRAVVAAAAELRGRAWT
jgi:2-dehydro-3-deoxyphosphogluconate aldolase / (4S)-4-hydroxy-2-oxoglutarate aldolase